MEGKVPVGVVAAEGVADVLRVIPAGRWRGDQVYDDALGHVEISAVAFQPVLDLEDPRDGIIGDLADQMRCEFDRHRNRGLIGGPGGIIRLRSLLAGCGSRVCCMLVPFPLSVMVPLPVMAPLPVVDWAHPRPALPDSSGRFEGSIWDS